MKDLSLPSSSANPSLRPLCPRLVKSQAGFAVSTSSVSHFLHIFYVSPATIWRVCYLPAHLYAAVYTHRQTQTWCVLITSDFDKVMSNSHLSELVDRLATGGNWIQCDRVLSKLRELDIKSRSPPTQKDPLVHTNCKFSQVPSWSHRFFWRTA